MRPGEEDEEVRPLLELAVHAVAERLGMDVEDLPAGIKDILRRFGVGVLKRGVKIGEDNVYDPPTLRTKTDPYLIAQSKPPSGAFKRMTTIGDKKIEGDH